MDKQVTLQTIDKDLKRELRINNYLQVCNRNQLVNVNKNIIGSTSFLSKQIQFLGNSFYNAIDEQTAILEKELSGINFSLRGIESNIVTVGRTLKYQTQILNDTLEKLDEIHNTLKHPLEVESKEQFERGIQWLEKGFLTEAVDAFKTSIEKNPTNYLSHFYLGVLYLCGKDEDDDVVDFSKSEEELKLAIKYSKPDSDNNLVKQYIVAIHQHLSDLFYAKALSGDEPDKNYAFAYEELQKVLKLDSSEETVVCLASRLIHCASKLGKSSDVIEYAKIGFLNDNSSLCYLVDDDLLRYRNEFIQIIDEVRPIIKDRVNHMLTSDKPNDLSALNEIISITNKEESDSYVALSSIQQLLSKKNAVPKSELEPLHKKQPEQNGVESISKGFGIFVFDISNMKIALIKLYREYNPECSLAEAKEAVENTKERGNPLLVVSSKVEALDIKAKFLNAGISCEIKEL